MKKIKRLLLLFAIAIAVTVPVSFFLLDWNIILRNSPIIKGTTTSYSGNSETYLSQLEEKALSGDANAMFRMGNNYRYGYNGLEKDSTTAIEWYEKAIEHGDTDAMNTLGIMIIKGEITNVDISRAINLLTLAADKNNSYALYSLGAAYWLGIGVEQDKGKALKLWKESAEDGHRSAQSSLGWEYYLGSYVDKDYKQAEKWFRLAALNQDDEANYMMGQFYYYGYGVEQNYDEAKKWYERSTLYGSEKARYHLGYMYYTGKGGVKDYYEAIKYLRPLAEKNNLNAIFVLGKIYSKGLSDVERNDNEAFRLWNIAAYLGDVNSQLELSRIYALGIGRDKDLSKSYAWKLVSLELMDLDENISDSMKTKIRHSKRIFDRKITKSEKEKARFLADQIKLKISKYRKD